MIDDSTGDKPVVTPPALPGKNGRDVGGIASFESPARTSSPSAKSSPPSGRDKKKIGRPPKNEAGFSKEVLDEEMPSPEMEAARKLLEARIVRLLVVGGEMLADSRFDILKNEYPEDVARSMADKAKLNADEQAYFGALGIRLWRKYLGDKYIFTDEGIATMYFLEYTLRNWEGMAQARKIKAKLNAKANGIPASNGDVKQSGLQSEKRSDLGSETNGKINAGVTADRHAPGKPGDVV